MTVKIFGCGGTVDKCYNELKGELYFKGPHLRSMLEQSRFYSSCSVEYLMMKDSLDMTDQDRVTVLQACRKCLEDKIVIAHGTDTMPETANVLGENIDNKTIVLFGAMIPFVFGKSDALFNFGCAVIAVQHLDRGVYVTKNGYAFPWYDVKKNKEIGVFQHSLEV